MNRIYQGRVSSAELLDSAGNSVTPTDWDWEDALWEHHALFQDAVNYYIFCLLALAPDPPGAFFRSARSSRKQEGASIRAWEGAPSSS